ncbi:MAG: GNAT family N-acetyltransferase [Desulfobacterales bacterium]|nr:GNAT family N-acetyltransferase [Desulfobacterales bacterium]
MPRFTFLQHPSLKQIEQITTLYRLEGWWTDVQDDPDLVKRIIAGSHAFLVATEGDDIIGMGRVISDRASDAYIQDLTVKQKFRGSGIGSQIVNRLVARLKADGLSWIGVVAEKNSADFYAKLGFGPMPAATAMLKDES